MSQEQVNQAVLAEVQDFLGGPTADGDGWSFAFGEHLESNWGAVYGGALAAATLALARAVAPDRSPRSLHLQIVRSVPSGAAYATARMRHAGRTVGTVEVDVFDPRRKLAAIALVTMVTPTAVASGYHDTSSVPFRVGAKPVPLGRDSFESPVTRALGMTPTDDDGNTVLLQMEDARLSVDGSVAPGLQITVPWENLELTGPEAACLAADAVVAAPVLESFVPDETVGPNADLSLRFTTAPATRVVLAAGSMVSAQHGTATVAIEVQAGDQQLAHGLSTSLLLPPR